VASLATAVTAVGVLLPWTSDGPVALDGIQGPNDGWLVLILAVFALAWSGSLSRGSWIAVVAVLGLSLVIMWTALADWLDAREVSGASARPGLLLVAGASAVLAAVAVWVAADLLRARGTARPERPHAPMGRSG
jgi:O-antigen ligase